MERVSIATHGVPQASRVCHPHRHERSSAAYCARQMEKCCVIARWRQEGKRCLVRHDTHRRLAH
eukprot:4631992-Alexandrium_andersonii.AAC.1